MKISKKMLSIFVLAVFATLGTFSFSVGQDNQPNEKIGFKVTPADEDQKIKVHLYNLLELPTKVKVRSSQGDVLYRKNIKNEVGFAALLDFSRLPEGNYSITIEQKGMKITQHFILSPDAVVFGNIETWKLEEPAVAGLPVDKA